MHLIKYCTKKYRLCYVCYIVPLFPHLFSPPSAWTHRLLLRTVPVRSPESATVKPSNGTAGPPPPQTWSRRSAQPSNNYLKTENGPNCCIVVYIWKCVLNTHTHTFCWASRICSPEKLNLNQGLTVDRPFKESVWNLVQEKWNEQPTNAASYL